MARGRGRGRGRGRARPGKRRGGGGPKQAPQEEAEKSIELEGIIQAVLPGTMFHVELPNKHIVLAHISGRMRKRFIRLVIGDRVKLEMSPYDQEKARIVFRLK